MVTLAIRKGEKSKLMTWKWKILWNDSPLEWEKKSLEVIPINGEKKNHLKGPPVGGPKKKRLEESPIGGEKRSLELIPIGMTLDTEVKKRVVKRHFT